MESSITSSTTADKPNLVLLHGWGYDHHCWPDLMLQNLQAQYQLILVDLPGHGKDTFIANGDDHISQLDEWIFATKQFLPNQYHILGWSLGGQIAIRMAHEDRRIQSVTLMAVNPKFTSAAYWPNAMLPKLLTQFQKGYETLANKTLRRFASLQAKGSKNPKPLVAHMLMLMEVQWGKVFGLHLLKELDERLHLCQLTQPCYIELATKDALVPWRWVGQLSLPTNVQVNYVEGCHGYLLEYPGITKEMTKFLHREECL